MEHLDGKKEKIDPKKIRKEVLKRLLWYFPIVPRFKRMFQLPKTAENLTWHENKRIRDGKLYYTADSSTW